MAPTPGPLRERAESLWDDALLTIPEQETWLEHVRQSAIALGLQPNGVLAIRSARPRLLPPESCARDQAVVDAVTTALAAAAEYVLQTPTACHDYLGEWADEPALMGLFDLPSGYSQTVVFGRYDGSRRDDGLTIIEFNGGIPGGVLPTQASTALMTSWPSYAALTQELDVTAPDLGASMLEAVMAAWSSFGGTGAPTIAFAVPDEFKDHVAVSLAFMLRLAESSGAGVVVCDPGELHRAAGHLDVAGRRIDVVFRVFFTSMVAALGSRLDDLMAAARAGEVCLVTSFRAGLLGHKSLFAVVTDTSIDLDLPLHVRDLARQHLPWTRVVQDTSTTGPDGAHGSLLDLIRGQREGLVLKPADGTGGADVHLGWEMQPAQWQAALSSALATGTWIVQERVHLTSVDVPVLEVGFPRRRFIDDHNPIIMNDSVAGYYVRLSESGGVTNVSSGGGTVVPTFFVAERE